jgi:hypothetical protein
MDRVSNHAGAPYYPFRAKDGPKVLKVGTQQRWAVHVQEEETDGGNLAIRIMSATKPGGGGTSTFTLEDNPVDSIIRDMEGVRSWIAEYELHMQQVGEMVGNPPRENLDVAIQEAIQDPHRLRELECKVDHLTVENKKTTEQVRKLKTER